MKSFTRLTAFLWVGAALLLTQMAKAEIVYNNSSNDLTNNFNPGLLEVGDQIILGGATRQITNFIFQYYGVNFSGDEAVRLRFYANDGAPFNGYATPGTVLYDSGFFTGIGSTPRNTIIYDRSTLNGGVNVPDEFTWSVLFTGIGAGESAGVTLYDPPTTGSSYPDYWEFSSGSWSLKTNAVYNMNFAARAEATVPEPSAAGLLLIGSIGAWLARRKLRA
jgi:hypothetical protein